VACISGYCCIRPVGNVSSSSSICTWQPLQLAFVLLLLCLSGIGGIKVRHLLALAD
jgi:hypothetical protein